MKKSKTQHVALADTIDAGPDLTPFVLVPDGTVVDGSGRTKIMKGEVVEVAMNEFVRALVGRGELVIRRAPVVNAAVDASKIQTMKKEP
jgi:hypothetical protein